MEFMAARPTKVKRLSPVQREPTAVAANCGSVRFNILGHVWSCLHAGPLKRSTSRAEEL